MVFLVTVFKVISNGQLLYPQLPHFLSSQIFLEHLQTNFVFQGVKKRLKIPVLGNVQGYEQGDVVCFFFSFKHAFSL